MVAGEASMRLMCLAWNRHALRSMPEPVLLLALGRRVLCFKLPSCCSSHEVLLQDPTLGEGFRLQNGYLEAPADVADS